MDLGGASWMCCGLQHKVGHGETDLSRLFNDDIWEYETGLRL